MVTVYKEVEVEIDASDLDVDELIEAVEALGLTVIDDDAEDSPENLKKHIECLREDFINWKDCGMSNEKFEGILKSFFKDTIDDYIV